MTLKTYLSSTVEAAIALARQELGPETMLMSSRPAPPDAQHLGYYEVVFAAPKQSFDAILQHNGVEPNLIQQLANGPAHTLAARMEAMVSTASELTDTVALVGPPGRGKTSTLLKLAVTQGLANRRPVRILSADNRRFGSFGATLGLDFQFFENVRELDRALSRPSSTLTFIDTSRHDDLARCLSTHAVQSHLVLRADAPTSSLLRMAARFEHTRLIFTGLDEVETYGNLFSFAAQTKHPISYLSSGQRIPDDLEPATPKRLINLILTPTETQTLSRDREEACAQAS